MSDWERNVGEAAQSDRYTTLDDRRCIRPWLHPIVSLLVVAAWVACGRLADPLAQPEISPVLTPLRWDVIFSEFCHNQGQAMEKRRAKAGPGATSRSTLRQ